MSSIVTNSVNSAIVSGQFGLQQANSGLTQAATNIAQQTAQVNLAENGPQAVLANASLQGLSNIRNVLPTASDDFTSNLLSLKINSVNAQASSKVLEVANETVGTIIICIWCVGYFRTIIIYGPGSSRSYERPTVILLKCPGVSIAC